MNNSSYIENKIKFINVLFILLFFFNDCLVFAVPDNDTTQIRKIHNYSIPAINLLSTHPLGLFISRIDNSFQTRPVDHTFFNLNIASGNVWLPYVIAYRPVDEEVRKLMEGFVWHDRWNHFDLSQMPSDSVQLEVDAIIKVIRTNIKFRLAENHELGFDIRSFLITRGQFPFSIVSSDELIEYFHTKIKGGEDPFARKYYGFNKAGFRYTDVNGKTIDLKGGDFLIPGIETHYYYYPDLSSEHNLFLNFGAHLGINISRFNPSCDFGLSSSLMKSIIFSDTRSIQFGIGMNALRQNLFTFRNAVEMSNRNYMFTGSGMIEYKIQLKDHSILSAGINYSVQSQYMNNRENEYQVLIGNRISTHWHYAISHLYRPLEAWNLILRYSKKYSLSVYLKEDLNVNNAPDIQTGLDLQIPVFSPR